ncbi:hypothetical protein GCM10027168_33430 [Streptomyces capparidis]
MTRPVPRRPYGAAMSARDEELEQELGATLEARRELGSAYDSALVESFLAKLDARLDGRVEQRVRRELAERAADGERRRRGGRDGGRDGGRGGGGALPYVSLVLAVPLSAIAGETAGLVGVVAAWLGIVGVNVANTWPPHLWLPWARGRRGPASEWDG